MHSSFNHSIFSTLAKIALSTHYIINIHNLCAIIKRNIVYIHIFKQMKSFLVVYLVNTLKATFLALLIKLNYISDMVIIIH